MKSAAIFWAWLSLTVLAHAVSLAMASNTTNNKVENLFIRKLKNRS